jgi:hypothetical protein
VKRKRAISVFPSLNASNHRKVSGRKEEFSFSCVINGGEILTLIWVSAGWRFGREELDRFGFARRFVREQPEGILHDEP